MHVADLYFLRGLTMEAIAADLDLSRSTVSRMVQQARRLGVIEFTLHRSDDRSRELADGLTRRHGIAAQVVATADAVGDADRLDRVASRAAERLRAAFGTDMTLAVSWGTTMETVARRLVPSPTRGARVVQLNGSGNTFSSGIPYASRLLDQFGMAFDASVHHFPVPAFFDSAATKRSMWRERSVRRVVAMQRRADVVLFSVGALTSDVPGHLYRAGYLDQDDVAQLQRDGVVGDLGSVFLRADGSSEGIAINDRTTGMPVADLQRIRTRMLVASGPAKVPAILAALRAGAITDLVTDAPTAEALLRSP